MNKKPTNRQHKIHLNNHIKFSQVELQVLLERLSYKFKLTEFRVHRNRRSTCHLLILSESLSADVTMSVKGLGEFKGQGEFMNDIK